MRQRGTVPVFRRQPTQGEAEQAEQFRQRSTRARESARQRLGGGGSNYIRYVDDEQVYEDLFNKFMYTHIQRMLKGSLAPDEGAWFEWNEQVVRYNLALTPVADKERWLNADPWDVLHEVHEANHNGQFSPLFYHNDYYQAA